MHVLARRGVGMLKAKRCIEALIQDGKATIELPTVESGQAVMGELATAGVEASLLGSSRALDVRAIRQRLGLTREQFALRYGLEAETLKNWETGKREPDTAARSYLHVISNAPEHVEQAYARVTSIP